MKKMFFVYIAVLIAFESPVHAEEFRFKPFVASLVLPGLGQHLAGSKGYAGFFIMTELALIAGYSYNRLMMKDAGRNYISWGSLYSGTNIRGRDTEYLNAIGYFNSSFDHNKFQLQISDNPLLYAGADEWSWESEERRLRFRNLRERELLFENNRKFIVAGIVLNHFLAAIHASRLEPGENSFPPLTVSAFGGGISAFYTRSY